MALEQCLGRVENHIHVEISVAQTFQSAVPPTFQSATLWNGGIIAGWKACDTADWKVCATKSILAFTAGF